MVGVTRRKKSIFRNIHSIYTYDHRVWRTGLPVRSAVLKPHAGQLVVWWVTTCESWLLYVFCISYFVMEIQSTRAVQASNIHIYLIPPPSFAKSY
ncbi:L-lysine 2-3-aminomutase [Penicillium daleae]|uniref:L-lysine 2-3-aminomutase n=1 Tax=Penicillium daleae TaxID=63821 RepID=A0AAD6CGF2_9EURO|nr:L-lysine 2-3-aminomutase [Penicillium daleae]KAJ5461225.1 L-lysine 2-3-aminomutase [Penicillium daleae]